LSSGNVSRLVGAGYDSVPKILDMKEADFLKVPGFKAAMASKLYNGIQEKVAGASLTKIMSASNVFGRGFSDSKIEMILREYPDVLVERDSKKLAGVKGMASKTAEAFVSKIPAFLEFLEDCGLSSKLVSLSSSTEKANAIAVDESHPLFGRSIVMTGFRDKKIIEELPKFGAKLGSSVSKNTFVVVVKDKDEATGKVAEAKKLGVPIMTPEEFTGKYLA
jgi:NAD-dependent DNA ligase